MSGFGRQGTNVVWFDLVVHGWLTPVKLAFCHKE
jgi:hypothetical protein